MLIVDVAVSSFFFCIEDFNRKSAKILHTHTHTHTHTKKSENTIKYIQTYTDCIPTPVVIYY